MITSKRTNESTTFHSFGLTMKLPWDHDYLKVFYARPHGRTWTGLIKSGLSSWLVDVSGHLTKGKLSLPVNQE